MKTKVVARYYPEDELLFMHDGRRGETAWGDVLRPSRRDVGDSGRRVENSCWHHGHRRGPLLDLRQGYDAKTDTLSIGETSAPYVVDGGVFVGYWTLSDQEEDGIGELVGVEIRDASVHLAGIRATLKPAE